jgi:hypothetical protein
MSEMKRPRKTSESFWKNDGKISSPNILTGKWILVKSDGFLSLRHGMGDNRACHEPFHCTEM